MKKSKTAFDTIRVCIIRATHTHVCDDNCGLDKVTAQL